MTGCPWLRGVTKLANTEGRRTTCADARDELYDHVLEKSGADLVLLAQLSRRVRRPGAENLARAPGDDRPVTSVRDLLVGDDGRDARRHRGDGRAGPGAEQHLAPAGRARRPARLPGQRPRSCEDCRVAGAAPRRAPGLALPRGGGTLRRRLHRRHQPDHVPVRAGLRRDAGRDPGVARQRSTTRRPSSRAGARRSGRRSRTPVPSRASARSPDPCGMMTRMRPMLATRGSHVPTGPEWSHEVKWDGDAHPRRRPRRQRHGAADQPQRERRHASSYPELLEPAGGRDVLLDGEVVALRRRAARASARSPSGCTSATPAAPPRSPRRGR